VLSVHFVAIFILYDFINSRRSLRSFTSSFKKALHVCKTNNPPTQFLIPAKAHTTLFTANSISYVLARDLQYTGQD
jgi:hypothetical protein